MVVTRENVPITFPSNFDATDSQIFLAGSAATFLPEKTQCFQFSNHYLINLLVKVLSNFSKTGAIS